MKTLEQIKDEYSIGNTGLNWIEFTFKLISNSKSYGEVVTKIELHLNRVAEIYAKQYING